MQQLDLLFPLLQDEVRQLLMRKSSSFARGASKFRGVTKHKVGPCTRLTHPPSFPSSSLLPSTRLLQTPTKSTKSMPGCVMRAVWLIWPSLCNHQQTVEAVTCPSFVGGGVVEATAPCCCGVL